MNTHLTKISSLQHLLTIAMWKLPDPDVLPYHGSERITHTFHQPVTQEQPDCHKKDLWDFVSPFCYFAINWIVKYRDGEEGSVPALKPWLLSAHLTFTSRSSMLLMRRGNLPSHPSMRVTGQSWYLLREDFCRSGGHSPGRGAKLPQGEREESKTPRKTLSPEQPQPSPRGEQPHTSRYCEPAAIRTQSVSSDRLCQPLAASPPTGRPRQTDPPLPQPASPRRHADGCPVQMLP